MESVAERTFQYQSTLPPLPVPSLEESLNKYLDAVKPFASEQEFCNTTAIVKRFVEGIGPHLHQRLLQRAKSRRNWLEDWWLDAAYLEVRAPSQLLVNFGGPAPYIEHCWPPCDGSQLERLSFATWHTIQYWDLIRTEKLAVHKAGNVTLDMDQFQSEGPCPSHLIVMCSGRLFSFDAVCDGRILTPPEIQRQLTFIKESCDGEIWGEGVAALTTEKRTTWAKAREHLISIDPANKTILETIQSSLFMTRLALTGDPTVRWGDKSYNLISFADGTFSSNCDHAPYDAMVLVSMCYNIDQKLRTSGGKWKSQDLQVVCYAFTSFGKAAIKKKKLHPDTFVQLAMQLAYYRQYGKAGSCYETATTRRFYHGRTETMRPCTVEALECCKVMLNPAATVLYLLELWVLGFDRHLLGLYLIAKEERLPVPELYSDPLYAKSGGGGNFVISSSLVGYTTVLGAVAPMVHHGYGFFYRIRDDRIVASCTAWKSYPDTDAETFFQNLCTSFHDIMRVMTLSHL
ncbi:Peroxisomal carnitine O-octanoyltransferase [Bagarius yarrelli]|uniref:Peroxisomal carnitine O-octanoyltransferase n=1 Tax=Bagarius yarrelli TaxID=175774 RepID=A0A556TLZ5_BAGYA|nr:Peroxisomal carnitine O-octanoyltransferase [Bagarius yarrelli]